MRGMLVRLIKKLYFRKDHYEYNGSKQVPKKTDIGSRSVDKGVGGNMVIDKILGVIMCISVTIMVERGGVRCTFLCPKQTGLDRTVFRGAWGIITVYIAAKGRERRKKKKKTLVFYLRASSPFVTILPT